MDLSDAGELNKRIAKAFATDGALDRAMAVADRDLEAARRFGAAVVPFTSRDFPELLRAAQSTPFLHVLGELEAVNELRCIAVVGTRRPTAHGRITAERISAHFAGDGWVIASGLALGIDGAAHESALAVGGRTVAVLPVGLDRMVPRQHRELSERIVRGGALVSEYPMGTEPRDDRYVARDKIQAALAAGVVMVQSGLDGGSLHASRAALRLGRVLAVPHATDADVRRGADAIQANLVLAGEEASCKADLLRCQQEDLERLVILRSKADYPALAGRLSAVNRTGLFSYDF